MSSSAPTATAEDTPTSFIALKEPLLHDVITIFKKSHEFNQIQHDYLLDIHDITSTQLWEPFLFAIVNIVR